MCRDRRRLCNFIATLYCSEGVMESWEDELERNLCFDLGFEEDMEDEFENELFMQMVDVVSSELLGDLFQSPSSWECTRKEECVP